MISDCNRVEYVLKRKLFYLWQNAVLLVTCCSIYVGPVQLSWFDVTSPGTLQHCLHADGLLVMGWLLHQGHVGSSLAHAGFVPA